MEGAQSVFHPFRLLTHTHQSVVARGDAKITYILSEAARGIIEENHRNGMFSGREDATDPPYMAPSTNPEDYSKVGMIQHFWVGNAYDTMAQSGARHASITEKPLCFVLGAVLGSVSPQMFQVWAVQFGIQPSTTIPLCTIARGALNPQRGLVL